jgi:hypothetical protein
MRSEQAVNSSRMRVAEGVQGKALQVEVHLVPAVGAQVGVAHQAAAAVVEAAAAVVAAVQAQGAAVAVVAAAVAALTAVIQTLKGLGKQADDCIEPVASCYSCSTNHGLFNSQSCGVLQLLSTGT